MAVQFLDIDGKTMAILPVGDYQSLLEIAETNSDMALAILAETRRLGGEEYLPSNMVDRLIAGESALRVWRKHRKLTLAELGNKVGAAQSYLSEIENGVRQGKPSLWRKLAVALHVDMEDIVPDNAE